MFVRLLDPRPWMLASLALAVALGCSGESEPVARPSDAELPPPPPPPSDEPLVPSPSLAEELPDSFPDDITPYAGADLVGVTEEAGKLLVQMQADSKSDDVIEFYAQDLEAKGWQVERRYDPEDRELGGAVLATKGDRSASVFVMATENGSSLHIFCDRKS